VIHIYCTSGAWLSKWWNQLALALALVLATLCRHNAILFTLPLLIAVILLDGKKRYRAMLVVFCVMFFLLIKFPLYSALDVTEPNQRQSEVMGLPMTIIGNVVKKTPEVLDDDMKDFVYSIATQEQWEEKYETGSWNSFKFNGANIDPVDQEDVVKILKITMKCFIKSPEVALESLCKLTGLVWALGEEAKGMFLPNVVENSYGIVQDNNSIIWFVLTAYGALVFYSPLKFLFTYIGSISLVILAVALSKYTIRDYKRLLLCLPLFTYNFGTMLLLSGSDFRFFYYSFAIAPLLIFLLLIERKEANEIA